VRLFSFVVSAVAPAVTMDEATYLTFFLFLFFFFRPAGACPEPLLVPPSFVLLAVAPAVTMDEDTYLTFFLWTHRRLPRAAAGPGQRQPPVRAHPHARRARPRAPLGLNL